MVAVVPVARKTWPRTDVRSLENELWSKGQLEMNFGRKSCSGLQGAPSYSARLGSPRHSAESRLPLCSLDLVTSNGQGPIAVKIEPACRVPVFGVHLERVVESIIGRRCVMIVGVKMIGALDLQRIGGDMLGI